LSARRTDSNGNNGNNGINGINGNNGNNGSNGSNGNGNGNGLIAELNSHGTAHPQNCRRTSHDRCRHFSGLDSARTGGESW